MTTVQSSTYYWTRQGLRLLAFLYLIHCHVLPGTQVKQTIPGLEQPRLNLQDHEENLLVDPKTGELNLQGWEVDGEMMVTDNLDEAS